MRPLGSVRRMARSVVFRGEASQARDAAGTAASVAAAAVASSGAALAAVAEGNWEAPWGRLLPQSYLELALSECGLRDEHGRVCSRADRMAAFDHMGKHGLFRRYERRRQAIRLLRRDCPTWGRWWSVIRSVDSRIRCARSAARAGIATLVDGSAGRAAPLGQAPSAFLAAACALVSPAQRGPRGQHVLTAYDPEAVARRRLAVLSARANRRAAAAAGKAAASARSAADGNGRSEDGNDRRDRTWDAGEKYEVDSDDESLLSLQRKVVVSRRRRPPEAATAPDARYSGRGAAGATEADSDGEDGSGGTRSVSEASYSEEETDAEAIDEARLMTAQQTLAGWVHVGPPMTGAELELRFLRNMADDLDTEEALARWQAGVRWLISRAVGNGLFRANEAGGLTMTARRDRRRRRQAVSSEEEAEASDLDEQAPAPTAWGGRAGAQGGSEDRRHGLGQSPQPGGEDRLPRRRDDVAGHGADSGAVAAPQALSLRSRTTTKRRHHGEELVDDEHGHHDGQITTRRGGDEDLSDGTCRRRFERPPQTGGGAAGVSRVAK